MSHSVGTKPKVLAAVGTSVSRPTLFLFFFVSGFCGLLYQVVWIRLAFAAFGIITPILSLVIAVFMLGLALGSWAGGRWIERISQRTRISPLVYYGLAELLIGVGAFVMPILFSRGEAVLLPLGDMDSARYLFLSALIITGSILPWCILMGATFPLMLAFVKQLHQTRNIGFSFLYSANVVGAMCGTLLTALVLVEQFGFGGTLLAAAGANFSIALASLAIGLRCWQGSASQNSGSLQVNLSPKPDHSSSSSKLGRSILFTTGFASMAMEVAWTRAFTPVLKTTIYSFALLLTTYLLATWTGSQFYRRQLRKGSVLSTSSLMAGLAVFSFLPVVLNDPRVHSQGSLVLASIFPFCAALGFLTPKLVDEYSSGQPTRAGSGYALNILGSILGPLLAGYLLLPLVGVRIAMILLAIPFLLYSLVSKSLESSQRVVKLPFGVAACLMLAVSMFWARSYEDAAIAEGGTVRRDYTATVISSGDGMKKRLLVNGIGITQLTPITKLMAHLPLALLDHEPKSALVICFGMGTTFRSLMSWNIKTAAVELVPSVRDAFPYYFSDARSLTENSRGKIVIDDGRRFLKRTLERFDVITVDPPPPAEAAGSSLLYSESFYALARERLNRGGILQQWFAIGEKSILQAVARSLEKSFPHVRAFRSVEGWGYHFLASCEPIRIPGVDNLILRIPASAQVDLMEWQEGRNTREFLSYVLDQEIPLPSLLSEDRRIFISDDHPYNEYYLVRRSWATMRRLLKSPMSNLNASRASK